MGWLVAFKSLLGHEPPSLRNKEDHSKNSQVKGLSGSILCDFAHPGKIFLQTILHVFVTRLVARFHPLIMRLAGLRPAWRRGKVRGHLALRQGTLSPAPLFLRGSQSLFLLTN